MKCNECTEFWNVKADGSRYERKDWCIPDDLDDKEDSCENFSRRCDLCNADKMSSEGECCEDLISAREEDGFPCPKKPNKEICGFPEKCPGCFTPEEMYPEVVL